MLSTLFNLSQRWLATSVSIALFGATFTAVQGAEVTLDFSGEQTLKGLFDAGMRPYRGPHSERFQVETKEISAQIKLPSGTVINKREWQSMQFSVISDGRLTSAQMRSNPLSLDEAKIAMSPLLALSSEMTTEALDAFLQKVKERPFLYEGDFHIGTGKRQNPMFSAAFFRTGLKDKPLALRVTLEWQVEPKSAARSFYKRPIPPPPGYENESMEKPPFSEP